MALENGPLTGDKSESNTTLVWNLRALRRRSLLLSGDSRGRITLWCLPTCVALQTLHVHVADVLDMQLMVCIDSLIADHCHGDAPTVKRKEEVVLSVGVDGKLSAISRTEEDRWVVRACRYPHLCDSQALACLPRVPGGPDGSLIVTGAADGSIKWMRNLTELAGLKAPCLPFCLSPSLRGLQRPKVIWKKRLLVCPSSTEIGIWDENTSAESPQSPLIKLAKISLQKQSKINCCDAAKDGQLLAVGSNDGLHLFGFHVKELEIQDLQCLGACRIKEMVTALQFVSRSVLACCFFSNKKRKTTNYRRLREGGKAAGSASTSDSAANGAAEKTQKGRGKTEDECCSATSKKWICKDVPSLRETEALPDRLGETDGSFCISFVKISTGMELASVRDLPFPVVYMDLSPDGKKLGCLNSNSSIFVFDVDSLELVYFLPNIFRRGENVANFCFSPDSTRLFVLGTRNGYFLTEPNELDASQSKSNDNNSKCEGKVDAKNRKPQRQRRSVRSIPARQLSREDGSIVHCKWVEEEGTEYVLCMTPSSLYKLSLGDVAASMDADSRPQKEEGKEIRLLNLSSDSEEDRDCQANGYSSQTRSFPRQLKKLRGQRSVMISAPPVYATPFCVPRVLPASLSGPEMCLECVYVVSSAVQIPARQLSREDGSIVHCKWVEEEGTEYVLCMTPSSLYKLSLGDVAASMDADSRPQKEEGKEIRLLNLSSDSEEDRDCQANGYSSQTRSFPRQLKKLRGQRSVMISAPPVYATPFCVPRVLPASLSGPESKEELRGLWSSQGSPCGATPGGTDSTRSTATTPGDSPISHQRGGDRDAPAESSGRKRMFNSIAHTARLLRQSDNKGFVGFALEKCDVPTATQMLPLANGPCSRALVLLEMLSTGTPNESSLPPFNRKRYGT
ncbi:hypothetical protein, conserved [Eimeria praecox]|uniref:WD domain, G-beta repeat-containing protein n=1 Tax=Eimeria praecox TaxID=51316 RepID=U6GK62_9EIME|nr:hypothetical protein, conserved [Eimeria praecox]